MDEDFVGFNFILELDRTELAGKVPIRIQDPATCRLPRGSVNYVTRLNV